MEDNMGAVLNLGVLSRGRQMRVLRHALALRQVDLASIAHVDTKDVRRCEADYFQGVSQTMIDRLDATLTAEAEARGLLERGRQLELAPEGRER